MDTRFIEGVLLRCFLYGIALLLFWFVIILIAGGLAYSVHSSIFDITRREFDLMNYYGMALFKMFVFMVFLIPYLAIRFTAKSQKSAAPQRQG